jgi:alanine racemase
MKWESIDTPRLLLRAFKESDLADLSEYAAQAGGFEAGGRQHPQTADECRALLNRNLAAPSMYAVVEKASGRCVGHLHVKEDSDGGRADTKELGCVLNENFRGHGLMDEAIAGMLGFLFAPGSGIEMVYACCFPSNVSSRRMIEKCGFRFFKNGTHQSESLGQTFDSLEFRMSRADWSALCLQRSRVPAFEKHCWAEINLDALRHNFSIVRGKVKGPVCCVVKADAYGHGDSVVAPLLQKEGAAAFAVSCLAEGRHLRRCGITAPILILGYTDPAFALQLVQQNITQALFSAEYAQALSAEAQKAGCTVACHLKADTGMGRIGFCVRSDFEAAVQEMEACYSLPGLSIAGLFQHFAVADSDTPDNIAYTEAQHALFAKVAARLTADGFPTGTVHCANSAAQMLHPEWKHDLVRAGIILYGLDPSGEVHFDGLHPAMTLKAVVTYQKELLPGQSVSYGRRFVAQKPMQVATISVGYADGYPRLLSGRGVMAIHGCPAPVLGRVCMDQTLVDVTNIPNVRMGDEVTVFGPDNAALGADTADTVAAKTDTINYEIVCGISRRVPRVYLAGGAVQSIWNDLEG